MQAYLTFTEKTDKILAMRHLIYADYAASTPTDPRVAEAMTPYLSEIFGNPSSIHSFGKLASQAVERATAKISNFLNSKPNEVIYTSCGTESNNLAVLGIAKANKERGKHIITSVIEHPSILNACRALEKDGWEVTYLPVTQQGIVESNSLKNALNKETVLVSIHLANSEIGVIQNVTELAKITKVHGAYFHTDACQAAVFLDLDVEKLGVDLLTFNGSKMYGPKGIAVLYVREGTQIFPIIYGGGQQQSLRSGTENVPGIVGLAASCDIASKQRTTDGEKIGALREQLQKELEKLQGVKVNCTESPRLPNHLSVTLAKAEATDLVKAFDEDGIAVSSGSACGSKSLTDSHILQSIGLTSDRIHKTVRITLGRPTQVSDITTIAKVVATV
jgi:cysteine desulfurase